MALQTMYPPQKDSPSTYLLGDIGADDVTLVVAAPELLPQTVPFPLTIGFDKSITETVLVTNIGASGQLTIERGNSPFAWIAGVRCARVFTASDQTAIQENITAVDSSLTAETAARQTADSETLDNAIKYTDNELAEEAIQRETADDTNLDSANTYTDTKVAGEAAIRQNEDANTLSSAKTYTDTETAARQSADTTTLNSAKAYTDAEVTDEATARQNGDATTLNGAKAYTDTESTARLNGDNALDSRLDAVEQTLPTKEDESNKGVPNGYAPLDANGHVPLANLSDTVLGQLTHAGELNASSAVAVLTTNGQAILGTTASTITLTDNTAATTGYTDNQGNYYVTQTAGIFAGLTLAVGDWLVANASGWGKVDNTDAVSSVNGKTGAVNLTYSDVGAPPLSHRATSTAYGVSTASYYGHAKAGTVAPSAPGTAAVGTDNGLYSRADHVHPKQTNAADLTDGLLSLARLPSSVMREDVGNSMTGGTIIFPANIYLATVTVLQAMGVNISAAELSYIAGLTSDAQTQFNALVTAVANALSVANTKAPINAPTFTGLVNLSNDVHMPSNSVLNIGTGASANGKIVFGDGDYVHISEPSDDTLEIKGSRINLTTAPKFPTPASTVNDTTAATTAFVQSLIAGIDDDIAVVRRLVIAASAEQQSDLIDKQLRTLNTGQMLVADFENMIANTTLLMTVWFTGAVGAPGNTRNSPTFSIKCVDGVTDSSPILDFNGVPVTAAAMNRLAHTFMYSVDRWILLDPVTSSKQTFTATIPVLAESTSYTTVTVAGLLATDTPIIGPVGATEAMLDNWGKITRIDTVASAIRVYRSGATTASIPIQLMVVR